MTRDNDMATGSIKKALGSLFTKMDNWMNPVVVKELRQAMRTKMITWLMMLFLLAQILVLSINLLDNANNIESNMYVGREIFQILLGVLMFAGILCLPAYAAFRLGAERMGTDVDLIFITALSPRRIISGKFLANSILAMVIYSACMPFMTFTYLLRGIDMSTIFACLAYGILMISLGIMAGIFFACIPGARYLKILVGMGGASVFFGLFVAAMDFYEDLIQHGVNSSEFWENTCIYSGIMLAIIACFYVLATALIMPPAANRALPIRIFTVIIWLASWGVAIFYYTAKRDEDPLILWCVASTVVCCCGLLMAISERQYLGARITRKIPKNRLLRPLAFLFYSGAGGGMVFFSLLALCTLGLLLISLSSRAYIYSTYLSESMEGSAGMFLSIFSYAMLALWLRRIFFEKKVPHYHSWAMVLFLIALGTLMPLILSAMISHRGLDSSNYILWLGNPFTAFNIDNDTTKNIFFGWVIAWSLVMGLANFSWFIKQIAHFQPYREKAKLGSVAIKGRSVNECLQPIKGSETC